MNNRMNKYTRIHREICISGTPLEPILPPLIDRELIMTLRCSCVTNGCMFINK